MVCIQGLAESARGSCASLLALPKWRLRSRSGLGSARSGTSMFYGRRHAKGSVQPFPQARLARQGPTCAWPLWVACDASGADVYMGPEQAGLWMVLARMAPSVPGA